MPSLKAKQLLIKAAQRSQKKEEKISRKEIEKKIHQIKYLASDERIPKAALRKEVIRLEKLFGDVALLEKKLKENEREKNREIAVLKKQVKGLKKKMYITKDAALRKRVEKLSHFIGDLMAKEAVKKEVAFEHIKEKFRAPEKSFLTLKKIGELQEKILVFKKLGRYSPEKIAELEQRLIELGKKLPIRAAWPKETARHKMLFGPQAEEEAELPAIEPKEGLPLPPPKKKKQEKKVVE